MRWFRSIVLVTALVVALPTTAHAKNVSISVTPNPAVVGDFVRHDIGVGAYARLDVWVSASGFAQPGSGTLPPGSWIRECCSAPAGGTSAWHYRSSAPVVPGAYRFRAEAVRAGTFASSVAVGAEVSTVWIRIR